MRTPRTSQPDGRARIDWSNPLTRDLIGAWLPAVQWPGQDMIRFQPAFIEYDAGGTIVQAKFGKTLTTNQTMSVVSPMTRSPDYADDYTIAAIVEVNATPIGQCVVCMRTNGGSTEGWVGIDSNRAIGCSTGQYGGSPTSAISANDIVRDGLHTVVYARQCGTGGRTSLMRVWLDGQLVIDQVANDWAHGGPSYAVSPHPYNAAPMSNAPVAVLANFAWWGAKMDQGWHNAFARAPWEMYEPEVRDRAIFLPPRVTSTTKKWHAPAIKRTTHPRGFAQVDVNNPLTHGMVCISTIDLRAPGWVANHIYPWSWPGEGGFGYSSGVDSKVTPYGQTMSFAGGGYNRATGPTLNSEYGSDATVMAVFVPENATDGYLSQMFGPSYYRPGSIRMSGGAIQAVMREDWGGADVITHQHTAKSGVLNTTFFRRRLTADPLQDLWLNGVRSSTVTNVGWDVNHAFPVGGYGFGDSTWPPYSIGYLLHAQWYRFLSEDEVMELSRNPWQLFLPDSHLAWTDHVTLVPSRYARPISDTDVATWQASSGTDRYAMIDEEVADDGDYIFVQGRSTYKTKLTALGSYTPGNNVVLSFRGKSLYSHSVKMSIVQGASTEIAAFTQAMTTSVQQFDLQLTAGQISSVTNWADLYLWIESL